MRSETLSVELKKYGYVFSMKKSAMLCLCMFWSLILLGKLFMLDAVSQAVLCVTGIAFMPLFLRNTAENRYHQKRFSDLNVYMEQFLYSFARTGKILDTLEDLGSIFEEGQMKSVISEALYHIWHTYREDNVCGRALDIISKAYPFDGVETIHNFAITTEQVGGDCRESIRLLLEYRRMFADRVYVLQQEQRKKRRDVIFSIIASLLLCGVIFKLSLRMGVDISGNIYVRAVTVGVLIADLVILYRTDKKLTVGLIESNHDMDSHYAGLYKKYFTGDRQDVFCMAGRAFWKKKLVREIEKQYPVWLMELSLLLQTENVAVAMERSLPMAPEILKPAIADFVMDIRQHPEAIEPYLNFLSEFQIPEISSSMKMLYSISQGSGGDAGMQIADIIRRNRVLYDRSQKLLNEDSLAGMYAMFLAPQLTGGVKMLVDMALILVLYMNSGMM